MPFELKFTNRIINMIKSGLGTGVLGFSSAALHTGTTDSDGFFSHTYEYPYAETSTLLLIPQRSPIDITGLSDTVVNSMILVPFLAITESTNTGFTIRSFWSQAVSVKRYSDGGQDYAMSPTQFVGNADDSIDVLVLEVSA